MFFIPIQIIFFLGGALELSEGVQMTLSPIYDSTMPIITLTGDSIEVGAFSRRTELSSNLSICGWYAIDCIQVKVGKILFFEDCKVLRLSAQEHMLNVGSHASLQFFVYPPPRSFHAVVSPASYLHLAQSRSILIEMKTGWNEIELATLTMKCGTAGLRLRLHEAKIESHDDSERPLLEALIEKTQVIRLKNCSAESNYRLLIPYTVENTDVSVINAKLDVEYSTSKGKFSYSTAVVVNTMLPISVNVQDIFREDAYFSRITISPATLVPVRLWTCHMQDSRGFHNIESHDHVQGRMDVFPKEPANLIYRFTRRPHAGMTKNPESSLALSIRFSCLDDVVLEAMEKCFVACIRVSPITSLGQLLSTHLLATLRSQWSAHDLEVIGLSHEIHTWPYEDMGWDTVLIGLNVETRDLARSWLKKWHIENAVIPIYGDLKNEKDVPSRLVVIPVDIPTPPVVATASVKLNPRRTEAVTIGETLSADLQITYTQSWAAKEACTQEDIPLEISFEVLAPPETWVIGGMRKGYFPADGKMLSFPVILLPQRMGHLLLPSVEVKFYKAETSKNGVLPLEGTRVPCEVDIKSLSESVHVVSGLRETVVKIGADEAEAQAQASEKRCWLVGSRGRKGSGNTV